MATISGKRFQITDGAATPTNLFPYTVTEAVYGLSTVLANTQSAAVTAAAASAASLYVPLAGGTMTGALNIRDNSLNFVSSTAGSVIHRFANSSNHQPSWFDGTNWKTIAYAADLNAYLPLTGGTLTGGLTISTAANYPLTLNNTNSGAAYSGIIFQAGGTTISTLLAGTNGQLIRGGSYPIYDSGNSNKTDVAWSASSLTLANNNALYFKDSGGTARKLFDFNASNSLVIGRELNSVSSGDGELYVRSCGMYFQTTTVGGSWGTRMMINTSGNVGIGTSSPGYKLHVYGTSGASITPMAIFEHTGDYQWNAPVAFFAPNVTDGHNVFLGIGKGAFTKNEGTLEFYYAGNSSNSNLFGLGLYGVDFVLTVSGGGKVGIGLGTTAPSEKLHVAGAILSTGDQVISSDINLKTNLQDVTYSVKDIAKARAVTFDWKDGRGRSAGSIAQDWKPLIPELVHGEEGSMTLAYGQIALVNTIIEAREIEILKKRVAELEDEVNRLRS